MPQGRSARAQRVAHAWLRDQGSLTAAIIAHCQSQFSVALLGQYRARALPSEVRLLGIKSNEFAIVREVKLQCGDQTWVFARTVLPTSSLKGKARKLAYLGNRPLGAVLFASHSTQRRRIEMARFDARHTLFKAATSHLEQQPNDLWGRRTLFMYEGKPLLVNEIFLPDITRR